MSVIPPTVGHTLQGSCRAGGSHHMHGGVALPALAIAIRVPLPDSSPSPSRLRIAAESVTAHLVDSIQNALRAVNPFPSPGISIGAVHGRRGASADAQAAPVGPWKRSMAPRTRLSGRKRPY